ncbi:TonB-dependent receptor [Flavobacterium album]|uniref:TonB-dependent receptor n=1 Tax=Flavobacterium album TaxID=2175091 RepID=A0A2S1R2B9_9FLAO|nr:outer membrane beta-barrel family protein [Flavobacterium album]AWH86671.1 TonB-dependent receptor [Flavobacterium album]
MKYIYAFLLLVTSTGVFSQVVNDTIKNDSIGKMETELDEIVLEKKKKAIERKADRTIFNFEDQPQLNSGSLYDGLKKIPGLIISDVAGMLYQGKALQVYMDGRPLNIYSNELNAYMEGLPANSIEKVEIITQPGAEFPATSGGAIINIITSKNTKKYLSATYSNGYSYTKYDDSRHRFNNSLLLSSGNKLFTWQVNGGQSYAESYQATRFTAPGVVLSENYTDRANRFYYLKSGVKFDFKKDRLLLNYDLNGNNNTSYIAAEGAGFTSDDKTKTKRFYNDAMITYQKRFNDPFTKLDFRFNYNNSNNDFSQDSRLNQNTVLGNNSNQDFYQFKTDYTQELKLIEKTKISAGVLADRLDFTTESAGVRNLEYTRSSYAAYGEAQVTYKKFDFILGGRLESYDIHGSTATDNLIPFDLTRFFPNATIQYNIMPQVYLNTNFNKKISLPDTSSLNPNNTNYQNPNVGFFGNPNLEPSIFNNYEILLSAFEYFTINYSVTDANNLIINRIITTQSGGAASVSQNLPNATIHNFSFGIPVPYMLFTKGLNEVLKMDFNPDEINFLYIYAGSQKHNIPGVDTKAVWNLNFSSQIILPKKIKLSANFNTTTAGGNYYYYTVKRPLYQQLDLNFSRKFLSDNLSVSVYVNDLLNTNRQGFGSVGTDLLYTTKTDTRRVGFSLNYKIPTKNKLAKESNILSNEKQQQDNLIKN